MTRKTQLGFQPPAIGEEEIEAVADALRSGWLTTGPRAALLEKRMAEYLEAKHVLAVAAGPAARQLALVALGIGPGAEVITTSFTPAPHPSSSMCAQATSTSIRSSWPRL